MLGTAMHVVEEVRRFSALIRRHAVLQLASNVFHVCVT